MLEKVKVNHVKYGKGFIKSVSHCVESNDLRLAIEFEEAGDKLFSYNMSKKVLTLDLTEEQKSELNNELNNVNIEYNKLITAQEELKRQKKEQKEQKIIEAKMKDKDTERVVCKRDLNDFEISTDDLKESISILRITMPRSYHTWFKSRFGDMNVVLVDDNATTSGGNAMKWGVSGYVSLKKKNKLSQEVNDYFRTNKTSVGLALSIISDFGLKTTD